MTNLEKNLKHLIIELEAKRDEYKDMDNGNKEFFRGKSEAYWFAAKSLKNLLIWHGVIDTENKI